MNEPSAPDDDEPKALASVWLWFRLGELMQQTYRDPRFCRFAPFTPHSAAGTPPAEWLRALRTAVADTQRELKEGDDAVLFQQLRWVDERASELLIAAGEAL